MCRRILLAILLASSTALVANAMEFACVSSAFISCSLSGGATAALANNNDQSASLSPTESGVFKSSSEGDYVRCPSAVYDCLKSHEAKCPLVRKFIANLQAVCEPDRRRFIDEFHLCTQTVDNECGTDVNDEFGDEDEMYDGDSIDAVAMETLAKAKCDAIRKRHTCAHEVLSRERCSSEAINYFENQIMQEMVDANLTGNNCYLVMGMSNEEHRKSLLQVISYNDGGSVAPLSNDDPNNGATAAAAAGIDVPLASADGAINEVPFALKRELKSNSPNSLSNALSSSAASSRDLISIAYFTSLTTLVTIISSTRWQL